MVLNGAVFELGDPFLEVVSAYVEGKTVCYPELMEKATDVATISITGLLPNGLIPVDTEFCIFVTSLVSLVTSDDTLKWSILENE